MNDRMSGGGERRKHPDMSLDWEDPTDKIMELANSGGSNNPFEESFKETLGTVDERRILYQELANQAINGIPLNPQEILVLSFGMSWDDEKARPIELENLLPQLARQEEITPGSTQVEQITSGIGREQISRGNVQERIFFPSFGTFGGGATAASGGSKIAGVVKGMMGTMARHPVKTAVPVVGGLSLLTYGIGAAGEDPYDPNPGSTTTTTPGEGGEEGGAISSKDYENLSDDEIDQLFAMGNIMVIDAATGRQIPLARYDAQQVFGKPPSAGGAGDEVSGGNFSPALLEKAAALGVTPQELAGLQVEQDSGFGTINPQMFGEIRLPLDTFPYGVDIGTGEALRTPRSKEPINPNLAKRLPQDDLSAIAMDQSYIPPGGQLNPRAFSKYKDDTLLGLISETAEMYDVPVELLYGLINAESGFVTNAMTPDGTRVGLAQIDLLRYPHISTAQASNPLFAIRWAGRELRMGANKYGGWEGAIASQIDPAEAEFLKKSGYFDNPGTKVFVEDVYGYANSSGIGKYMFDPDKIAQTRTRGSGSGSSGPKLPAYQAPDPNAIAQIARSTYKDMMGREPTEEEATSSAARLNELFREKYNSDIARLQGKSSTAVDPQASYEEGIRGLGEFEFREESRGTKDMMDFMGSIVSIMQGV